VSIKQLYYLLLITKLYFSADAENLSKYASVLPVYGIKNVWRIERAGIENKRTWDSTHSCNDTLQL